MGKLKIRKNELKECITEAILRVISEDIDEDWMDDLIAQAEADPAAKKAAAAAMKDMGDEGMGDDGEEYNPYGDEGDEEEDSVDKASKLDAENLSDEELMAIINDKSLSPYSRKMRAAKAEKKERDNALMDYKEGLPLPYGFKMVNGKVQRAHTNVGRSNDDAWSASGVGSDHKTFKWGGGED